MQELTAAQAAQVVLMTRGLDRSEAELRAFVDTMSEEAQAELVAVMWIGREAFEADDFREAVETAISEASVPTADYLIGTPHLSDHLEAGLEALGYSVNELEDDIMGR